ncbi:MAG TPA: hypothetical protein VGN90_01180 [Pyrinomonadaceae bacterium]|nr:hypothetical protein [Pyrinomonadaceae bacterium]
MKPTIEFIVICAWMLIGLCPTALAQDKYWREIKGKSLVRFDGNCASPEILPTTTLSRLIKSALKDERPDTHYYADRAFAYDLNRDNQPEYFVPLVCGATGNCTFGLFTLNPKRFLGKVNGEFIYVHGRRRAWPDLVTYGHFSAAEGTLSTYTFRRGRYKELPGYVRTDSRGGIFGKKVPAFLERARKGCKTLGE